MFLSSETRFGHLVVGVDDQHRVERVRPQPGILVVPVGDAHVAQPLALHPPVDRLEHLRLDVLGDDEPTRPDAASEADGEPAAAGADVGDDRAIGDAERVHDLAGTLIRLAIGTLEQTQFFGREQAAVGLGLLPPPGPAAQARSRRTAAGAWPASDYTLPMMRHFLDSMVDLITKTSTELPPDVRHAMKQAVGQETTGTSPAQAMAIIAENIDQASSCEGPICQDTGMPTFEIKTPVGVNQIELRAEIREAVAEATRRGKLRPNSVDSITGENSGDNLGPGTPILHFEQWERDDIEVKLILKGGGCENTNAQYALPTELAHLGRADRDLEGVRKCVLHAVWQAQGKGCSPGAVGVSRRRRSHVGLRARQGAALSLARRHESRSTARRARDRSDDDGQYARRRADGIRRRGVVDWLQDRRAQPAAGELLRFGGVRLLGVPAARRETGCATARLSSGCIAIRNDRRSRMVDGGVPGFEKTGRERVLTAPIDDATIRSLHVGDVVLVSGRVFTGRDAVHAHLVKHEPPVDLRGSVLYHCGPVVVRDGDGWRVTAAGPTTSIREEPYQADIIGRYGVRAVIGKGGMGARTLAALQEHGAVYLNAIGGAAQFYARRITGVDDVSLLEFGTPEAMWHLRVDDFPAIVTMDAHGNSLHRDVERSSGERLELLRA